MTDDVEDRAWLALAAGSTRQHAGNDGYDDDPSAHYLWDSTVPHHSDIAVGDRLVLWDKNYSIGASVIQLIEKGTSRKEVHRCPNCGHASIKARKTLKPRYRCFECDELFDEPDSSEIEVTQFRSMHSAGWINLPGVMTGAQLRALCVAPKSQQSFRLLKWENFKTAVGAQRVNDLRLVDHVAKQIAGGHKVATMRVRIGQGKFRRQLIETYGNVCALTGRTHPAALEAAHLYAYAIVSKHHEYGGLLLRSDIHNLFDVGLIAVNPSTVRVDVAPTLRAYAQYAHLHGASLHVEPNLRQIDWLRAHWDQHRTA